ncbi:MAG: hypothetical protein U1F19_05780 [Lysobacterales bacterium]
MTVPDEAPRSELLLYRGEDARTRIEVRLEGDSVGWRNGRLPSCIKSRYLR